MKFKFLVMAIILMITMYFVTGLNKVSATNNQLPNKDFITQDFSVWDDDIYTDSEDFLMIHGYVVSGLLILNDISSNTVNVLNEHIYEEYISQGVFEVEPTLLRQPTAKYNCISYAFYNQTTSNNRWFSLGTGFIGANKFYEVTDVQVGDRIAYYDSSNIMIHAGIITQILGGTPNGVCGDSNLYKVVSKWGYFGLYEHRGDQCIEGVGNATYVKYYRESHIYSYEQYNNYQHTATCVCGLSKKENHNFTSFENGYAICGKCDYHMIMMKNNNEEGEES